MCLVMHLTVKLQAFNTNIANYVNLIITNNIDNNSAPTIDNNSTTTIKYIEARPTITIHSHYIK